MKPYFEIVIEDGVIKAEGQGFEGEGCEAIADLMKALGETKVHKRKPEFYQRKTGAGSRITE